jgi:hypothetical protein
MYKPFAAVSGFIWFDASSADITTWLEKPIIFESMSPKWWAAL